MSSLKLDFKLLENDIKWISLIIFFLPIINSFILVKGGWFKPSFSQQQAVLMTLGSVSDMQGNWMFWLFSCFGYLILMQMIWKPSVRQFELNVLLRRQNITLSWFNKVFIGFFFTFLYVLGMCFIFMSVLAINGVHWKIGWPCFAIFFSLTINWYLHGIIWLTLKNFLSVKLANVILLVLIYAGVRIPNAVLPLFYGMYTFIAPLNLLLIWSCEIGVILILIFMIIYHGKRSDYF